MNEKHGAMVLCGGKSQRMGKPKMLLPFGSETLLERSLRILGEAVSPGNVVVVTSSDQTPSLPAEVALAHDARPGRGALEALAAGLRVVRPQIEAIFLTGCDMPLLIPEFVAKMFELMGNHDIAVPVDGEFRHPLAAVYRTSILSTLEELLAANRLKPDFLFAAVNTIQVPIDELREVDPTLASLTNLNTPEDYAAALAAAGFPPVG